MTLVLLSVCFSVVIWSAAMHISFLNINAEYVLSSRRRTKSLCDDLFAFTLKSCLLMHKLGMFITLKIYSKY